jgi:hypothetical protein
MKVARHEMPGKNVSHEIRPVGYGMIGSFRKRLTVNAGLPQAMISDQTVPYGTEFLTTCFQALRARLPSSHPFGVEFSRL